MGLLVGAPGSGKSEALRHLELMASRACPEVLQAFPRFTTLLTTYNGGNEPVFDELKSRTAFRRMLALRLLYAELCDPRRATLVRFLMAVKAACPTAWETLTPVTAIDLLRDWLGLRPGQLWLVLLGVDEINKLVEARSGLEPLTFLAQELGVLSSAKSMLPATLVVPFAAGTTATAGVLAFMGSGYKHVMANFTPLTVDDRGRILDALSEGAAPFLREWRACRPLALMIAFVGGHARMFASLVEVLREAGTKHPNLPLSDWDWTTIMRDVEGCLRDWSFFTLGAKEAMLKNSVLLRLLEDALLQTSVRRCALVVADPRPSPPREDPLSAPLGLTGDADCLEYGDLEITVAVVLVADPGSDELMRVYMPPVVMRSLMGKLGNSALRYRWGVCLRNLLVNYTNATSRHWQNWEVFTATAEAVKLALAWRRAQRGEVGAPLPPQGFPLGEYLGLEPDAIAAGPPQLLWHIRPLRQDGDVDMIRLDHQFPGFTSAQQDWAGGNVVLNAPGAKLGDAFVVVLATPPGGVERHLLLVFECRFKQKAPTLESLGHLQPSGAGWTRRAGSPEKGDLPRKLEQLEELARQGHPEFLDGGWLMVVMHPLTSCALTPAQVAERGPVVVLDAAGVRSHLGPVLYEVGIVWSGPRVLS